MTDRLTKARHAYVARQVASLDVGRVMELLEGGASEQAVARLCGVQRQAVGLLLKAQGLSGSALAGKRAAAIGAQRRAEQRARREEELRRTERPCRICGTPIFGALRRRTCGNECAEKWVVLRYQIDPHIREAHRLTVAKGILANPTKFPAQRLRWAERFMVEHQPPNRRFLVAGRRPAQLLEDPAEPLTRSP